MCWFAIHISSMQTCNPTRCQLEVIAASCYAQTGLSSTTVDVDLHSKQALRGDSAGVRTLILEGNLMISDMISAWIEYLVWKWSWHLEWNRGGLCDVGRDYDFGRSIILVAWDLWRQAKNTPSMLTAMHGLAFLDARRIPWPCLAVPSTKLALALYGVHVDMRCLKMAAVKYVCFFSPGGDTAPVKTNSLEKPLSMCVCVCVWAFKVVGKWTCRWRLLFGWMDHKKHASLAYPDESQWNGMWRLQKWKHKKQWWKVKYTHQRTND